MRQVSLLSRGDSGSPEDRPQPGMGSGKLLEQRAGVLRRWAADRDPSRGFHTWAWRVSAETGHVHLTAALPPLPGGHRKLLYYLNEGHYGIFRIFSREPVPKMPIVVKVRGPQCGSGVPSLRATACSLQSREAGITVAGGEVKELRLSMALQIAMPRACSGTGTRVSVCTCIGTSGGGLPTYTGAGRGVCRYVSLCRCACTSARLCVFPRASLHVQVVSRICACWQCRGLRKERFSNLAPQWVTWGALRDPNAQAMPQTAETRIPSGLKAWRQSCVKTPQVTPAAANHEASMLSGYGIKSSHCTGTTEVPSGPALVHGQGGAVSLDYKPREDRVENSAWHSGPRLHGSRWVADKCPSGCLPAGALWACPAGPGRGLGGPAGALPFLSLCSLLPVGARLRAAPLPLYPLWSHM